MKNIDKVIDENAADILEYLSEILPDIRDDGALGELVLQRALETYQLVVNAEKL